MIEAQTDSYAEFLAGGGDTAQERRSSGRVQRSVPIASYDGQPRSIRGVFHRRVEDFMAGLSAGRHHLQGPLHVTFRLKDKNGRGEKVYMGEIPLMSLRAASSSTARSASSSASCTVPPGSVLNPPSHEWQVLYGFRIIPTAVPGWKCSLTTAICSTSISTAAIAAANSWQPRSCALWGNSRTRTFSSCSTRIEDVKLKDVTGGEETTARCLLPT